MRNLDNEIHDEKLGEGAGPFPLSRHFDKDHFTLYRVKGVP